MPPAVAVGPSDRREPSRTGINLFSAELAAKRLDILSEVVPGAVCVGVLVNPANATSTEVPASSLLRQRLEDVHSLDLLEWTTYGHIALVDDVDGVINGVLKLDISQCSGFQGGLQGPMSNRGVFLSVPAKQGEDKHTRFTISGRVPVSGDLQVRRMHGRPRSYSHPLERSLIVFPH